MGKTSRLLKILGFSTLTLSLITLLTLLVKIYLFEKHTITGNKTIVLIEIAFVLYGLVFIIYLIKKLVSNP